MTKLFIQIVFWINFLLIILSILLGLFNVLTEGEVGAMIFAPILILFFGNMINLFSIIIISLWKWKVITPYYKHKIKVFWTMLLIYLGSILYIGITISLLEDIWLPIIYLPIPILIYYFHFYEVYRLERDI